MDAATFAFGAVMCLTSMVAGGALVLVGVLAARRFGTQQPALVGDYRMMLPAYPARPYPGRARVETFSTRIHSSTYPQISKLLLESVPEYTIDNVRYVNGGTLMDVEAHRTVYP